MKTNWHFSIVMLQWWEKEETQNTKTTSRATLFKWKPFLKLHVWKQLSNGSYYGAVIYKTKQNKIYTK